MSKVSLLAFILFCAIKSELHRYSPKLSFLDTKDENNAPSGRLSNFLRRECSSTSLDNECVQDYLTIYIASEYPQCSEEWEMLADCLEGSRHTKPKRNKILVFQTKNVCKESCKEEGNTDWLVCYLDCLKSD